ncbi:LytTR family DNA-binding domain-containing protein [Aquimarina gracilis]|uniref:LytTR family DNA-binding domain-containing protein n=1 Tax=Aquimarina gracilis TaxID=874422 RepID=A0ABU5ZQ04_9FLAO|nr:LytTR family DNA-binding domain-containing protein [Aquimarina gracilis]MEB3344171.1 LytTR family DNA-binding domain-containing protein [Aquimarina gracilis]
MKVVIVEDEPLASEKLERYLHKYDAEIVVMNRLTSIEEAVDWMRHHQLEVDLVFMDIQLEDGLSFEIFDKVEVKRPVIFTTAFDEFAIDAFKVNSIDYLLKPILFTDLSKALKKFTTLRSQFSSGHEINEVVKHISEKGFKNRFLVRLGNHIHSVKSEDISFFFAEGRDVYLIVNNKKKYIIEYTLEKLEELLAPRIFFRVNRSFIVNINSIQDVLVYTNRRLKLTLYQHIDKEVIVSREKVVDFKKWFEGN